MRRTIPAAVAAALALSAFAAAPAEAATIPAIDRPLVYIAAVIPGLGTSLGSGVVVTPGGEVVTNAHVVNSATRITVRDLANGRTYSAHTMRLDLADDVALLRIEGASHLPTATVGTPVKGQAVSCVGDALGTKSVPAPRVTGKVTSLHATVSSPVDTEGGRVETLRGLVSDTCETWPGDSGGATVAASGAVVGLNVAGRFINIGWPSVESYAIPMRTALRDVNA